MVGRVTMVCNHRISAESALCCSSGFARRQMEPIHRENVISARWIRLQFPKQPLLRLREVEIGRVLA